MFGFIRDLEPECYGDLQDRTEAPCWTIIYCNAAFNSDYGFNHFVPGFSADELGEEEYNRIVQGSKDLLAHKMLVLEQEQQHRASHYLRMKELHGGSSSVTEKAKHMLANCEERWMSLTNWQDFVARCHKIQVHPVNVPADGNCLLWTIKCLQEQDFFGTALDVSNPEHVGFVHDLRQTLSSAWLSKIHDKGWERLHEKMYIHDDRELCIPARVKTEKTQNDKPSKGARPSEVKTEKGQSSTPPKRPVEEVACFDIVTPEGKPTKQPRRDRKAPGFEASKACAVGTLRQPDRKGQRKQTVPEQNPLEAMEDPELDMLETKKEDEEDQPVSDLKPARSRAARKKAKTSRELRVKGLRNYLARLGVTYPEWMRFHWRAAGCRKAAACPDGQYTTLQESLLGHVDASTITCEACKSLLDEFHFDAAEAEQAMGLAEAGEATEPIPIQVAADAHSESNPSGEKDAPDAGVVPDDHEPEDLSLHAFANSIRRVVVKFVLKKFAAEHLQARLYHSDQKLKDVEAEIKADEIYLFHQAPFDRIINFRTHELQMWVRMSFHSISVNRRSEPFHSFVQTVVDPCMRVNVTSALQTRPQLLQAQVLFQEFLQNGDASVMDRVNAEIASATINGKLQHHPLLQGLTMSCLKMLDRQEKGLNMTGRNAATSIQATEEGRMLVQEAGATLAILGCNKEILKRFGQNSATRSVFEDMRAHSLPTPRLALATPTQVQENLQLIDHHLSATTMTSGCRCICAFDCTYLLQLQSQHFNKEERTVSIVGGAWSPEDNSHAAVEVNDDLDLTAIKPVIDQFMANGGAELVKCLCFDAHGSHQLIRRALQGVLQDRDHAVLASFDSKSAFVVFDYSSVPRTDDAQIDELAAADRALQLAAWAGNVTVESLKAYYIESCEADWFEKSHNFAPEFGNGEESDDEREAAQDVTENQRCQQALREIVQSAVHTVASEEEGQDGEGSTLQTVDLRRLDEDSRAELEPVLREEVRSIHFIEVFVLKIFRVRSLGGCKWNALFRLCLYLRAAPDGCDSMWLKNPRAKRKRPLTWCQENQQKLKVLQAKATENRDRVRAGRSGNLVLFVDNNEQIGLGVVLVVWRIGKKRRPSKPMFFSCRATSTVKIVPLDSLVAVLDCEDSRRPAHELINECVFALTPESVQVMREAIERKAEGWKCSYVGTHVVDSEKKPRRRMRTFKQTSAIIARKRAQLTEKKNPKKVNAKNKTTKSKKKNLKVCAAKIEPVPANFRRSAQGRSLIQQEMTSILEIDKVKFGAKPAFDSDGKCRLKIPSAENQTWTKVLAKSPAYFESIYSTRQRALYGESVHKHLKSLKEQVAREERSPWLRLLRALCEMPDVGARTLAWLLALGTLTSTIAAFLLTWINVANGTNFPGQLKRPLVTDIFYFISSFLWLLCCLAFCSSFSLPCRLLSQEAKTLESAPLAEALWAAKRLRIERAASMTTSFLTCMNFLGRAVCGIWSKWMPIPLWFFLDVLLWDIDDLANAFSLAVLSGLLYQDRPPELQKPDTDLKDTTRSCECCGGSEGPWHSKVAELASRSVNVVELINFIEKLQEKRVMPSFITEMSTTNDVVRQAIIPLSRRGDTGVAMASVWSGGAPRPPTKMVTHSWDNIFTNLVASIIADGLNVHTYSGISDQLSTNVEEVRKELGDLRHLSQYWICAFCINQHSCICSGFGSPPPIGTPLYDDWDIKRRDSVTGDIYPLCSCLHPKFFNSSPNECEMNKFDDMIHLLHCQVPDFIVVASVDYYFQVFMRAWCVAELVEAETCGISTVMKIHSEDLLDHYYNELSRLDVRACKASRVEDKAMILYRIRNVDAFNARLKWLIFGSQGLFKSWADAHQRAKQVGRIARRVQKRQAGDTGQFIVPVRSRYSGSSQGVSKIDEVLCRLRRVTSTLMDGRKQSKTSSYLPSSSESNSMDHSFDSDTDIL
ncbi:unnamed protein product [Durusdinium trenchii]|uniref:Uncharacterized protein n=1 Tax=Durusdinium trenchii TaxID=1381693 RepID=A0ABP0HQ80_9DINO